MKQKGFVYKSSSVDRIETLIGENNVHVKSHKQKDSTIFALQKRIIMLQDALDTHANGHGQISDTPMDQRLEEPFESITRTEIPHTAAAPTKNLSNTTLPHTNIPSIGSTSTNPHSYPTYSTTTNAVFPTMEQLQSDITTLSKSNKVFYNNLLCLQNNPIYSPNENNAATSGGCTLINTPFLYKEIDVWIMWFSHITSP